MLLLLLLLLPLVWAGEWVGAGGSGPARVPPGSPQEGTQPELHIQLPMQLPVMVQEGLCMHVPCTFSYRWGNETDLSPVYGHWFRKGSPDVLVATSKPGKNVKNNNKLLFHVGDPMAGSCALNITYPRRGDSGTYYFQVERGKTKHSYTHSGQLLTVRVTVLAQIPDITVEEPLEAGRPSRLTCSLPWACDGAPVPTISWTGAALRARGLRPVPYTSPELLLTPRPQDHGTELTCRVGLPRPSMSRARTLTLNVSYAPQNLTIRLFRGHCAEPKYLGNGSSFSVLEGESLRLLCAIDSNPPARLSWAWGRRAPSPSQPSSPGVLELPQVELGHEGEFTCHAQHPQGSLHGSLHLSVQAPPKLLGPSCSPEDEGLLCRCSARAQPAPSLRWRVGEQLLEGNSSNASAQATFSPSGLWANSSLRLSGGLSAALRLSCEAQNPQGTRSTVLLLLPGRAGKPGLGREFVLGAVGGAGVAGLLALCPGFVYFLVKTRKKGARENAAGQAAAPSTPGPTTWGHQLECQPGGTMDGPVPGPHEAEEHKLHYASLSFLSLRPWQPDQDATSTTEYSEIMIHK